MKIRKKSLWIDPNQGLTLHDRRAFGFVGTHDTDDYRGWFFTWPRAAAGCLDEAERESVLGSLELDTVPCSDYPEIPYRWAMDLLRKHLAEAC